MAIITCPSCGKKISDNAPACGGCGLAKESREAGITRVLDVVDDVIPDNNPAIARPTENRFDCPLCKAPKTVVATEVPRFPQIVRASGFFIALPAMAGIVGGFIVAVLGLFASASPAAPGPWGPAGSRSTTVFAGLAISISSLIGGTVGWLLIMNRKVLRCSRCGHCLDRA
ncbi:MAG: hypothetical protein AB1578_01960 [Thermodesulfobacteriota bacterium]